MLRRLPTSLLPLVIVVALSATLNAEMYDFTCADPQGGKLLLIGDEVMIGGPSGPGRKGFVVSTCSSNRGLTCIWFDRERDNSRILVVDDSKETPRVTFRLSSQPRMKLGPHDDASETVAWSWQKVKGGDDKSRDMRLRVEFGKFKGWYLASDSAGKLTLVRAPSDALQFHVYVVSK